MLAESTQRLQATIGFFWLVMSLDESGREEVEARVRWTGAMCIDNDGQDVLHTAGKVAAARR